MTNTERFNNLVIFYENLKTIMAAIMVNKGGIAMENYIGRFFAADALEFLIGFGVAIDDPKIKPIVEKYQEEFKRVSDLTTPSKKPVYQMTLEEFEKVMNI